MGLPIRVIRRWFPALALPLSFACGGKIQVVAADGGDADAAPDQPLTLATGPQFSPIAWLTVDANNVYCAGYNSGTVSKIPVGGGAPTVLARGISFPRGILVDATYVYWAGGDFGSWGKVPIAGGPPTQLGNVGVATGGIAFDGPNLLATTSSSQLIELVPLDGSASHTWWTGSAPAASDIDTDGVNAYWSEDVGGTIWQRPLAGGDALALATGQSLFFGVRVFGGNVYWSTVGLGSDRGDIRSVPVGGGPVQIVESGDGFPETFAVDSSGVYWTDPVDERIMRLPPGATTPEVVVNGQRVAWGLALDATSVYWTAYIDDTTGALRRAAK